MEATYKIILKKYKPIIFVYAFLVALLIISEIAIPGYLEFSHLNNVLRQASFLGIVAIGQNLVLLIGGMDMSVSYVITFANVLAASMINGKNENTLAAFVVCILIGAVVGLVNGIGVFYLNIPPMIMTLGTGNVMYGLAYIYSGGAPKGNTSDIVAEMANGRIGGVINGSLLLWIILAVITIIILKFTIFGRKVYALGINKKAALYSGVNISKITIILYVICGATAALAGVILLGYTGTSYFSTGDPYTLDSVAAVVIGGTAVTGGKGGYIGTIAGVLIMIILTSILTGLSIPEAGRQIVKGVIIIVMLLVIYGRKKSN